MKATKYLLPPGSHATAFYELEDVHRVLIFV